jgi:hypothetical protein
VAKVAWVQLEQRSGDIDPEFWFPCSEREGERDILYPSSGNTFRGRMPAWCEHKQVSYRVSLSDLPDDAPEATRLWAWGFLAGSVPQLDDDTDLETRTVEADEFLTTGVWRMPPSGGTSDSSGGSDGEPVDPLPFYSLVHTRGPRAGVDPDKPLALGAVLGRALGPDGWVYSIGIGETSYTFTHDELEPIGVVLDRSVFYREM